MMINMREHRDNIFGFLLGKERNPKKKYMIKGKKGEGTRDKKTSLREKKMIREKC